MTQAHPVRPGTTYMLDRRTLLGAFRLLGKGVTPAVIGYCLALAAQRHGVLVHAAMAMTNHTHDVITDVHGTLSGFMRDYRSLVARALNAEYGQWDHFWGLQRPFRGELVSVDDVWDKLVYTLTNPVAAGLVKSHRAWPGFHTRPSDVLREPLVFERPPIAFFERGDLPEEVTLQVTVPPAMADMTPEAFAAELKRRVQAREDEIFAEMRAAGRPFLGASGVLRQRRNQRPKNDLPRRRLNPSVCCKDTQLRLAKLAENALFRSLYAEARREWLTGQRPVIFPAGTNRMRTYPGVVVGERAPPGLSQAA